MIKGMIVMTERATFSLAEENYAFLNMIGGNKSAYINSLLDKERYKTLEDAILQANKEEAEDIEYQEELAAWDVALSDGI